MNAPFEGTICERRATLPASECFWALVDPKTLGRAAIAPSERGFLFEDVLPLQIESVQAAYVALRDGRVLACGVGRDALRAMDRTGVRSLAPDTLPTWLPDDVRGEIDPVALELLAGEFEPTVVRRARHRALASLATVASAVAALIVLGIVLRGRALTRAAHDVDERRGEIVRAALAGSGAKESPLPPELRLVAEVRELERTRAAELPAPSDVAPALAAILSRWPEGLDLRPDAISVSPRGASVRGIAATSEDMQKLADALATLGGWRIDPPQFRAVREGVEFTLSLAPEGDVR